MESLSTAPSATRTVVNSAAVNSAAKTVAYPALDKTSAIEPTSDLAQRLDQFSLEAVVDIKLARFLDQIGTFYPENLHELIINKVEKPLLSQILRRTGGNQVHAARILGINRNTLRKKMKMYGF